MTIKRMIFIDAYVVDSKVKHAICLMRDALILSWEDGAYILVYLNLIKTMQSSKNIVKVSPKRLKYLPEYDIVWEKGVSYERVQLFAAVGCAMG